MGGPSRRSRGAAPSLPLDGTRSPGVLASSTPDWESGLPQLGRRGPWTHSPPLRYRPLVCPWRWTWAAEAEAREGPTGPAKLGLEARLVCGNLWALFLVERERLASANLGRMVTGSAKSGSRGLSRLRVWPVWARAKCF